MQSNSGSRYHVHQYFYVAVGRQRYLHPGLSDSIQLRPSEYCIYDLYLLLLRVWEMGSSPVERWVEV